MCDHCGCREFPPIAELTAEHETILGLAWQLAEATRQRVLVDDSVRDELLRRLAVHVVKEENGLYPLLVEQGDLSVEASDTLEAEHRSLHTSLTHGVFDRREYYALAAHIEEEEMELFPAAMFAFDDDTWDEMQAVHHTADVADGLESRRRRARKNGQATSTSSDSSRARTRCSISSRMGRTAPTSLPAGSVSSQSS